MFSQIEILRLVKSPDGEGDITREYAHLSFAQGALSIHQNVIQISFRSSVACIRGDVVVMPDDERYIIIERLSSPRARYTIWSAERGMD